MILPIHQNTMKAATGCRLTAGSHTWNMLVFWCRLETSVRDSRHPERSDRGTRHHGGLSSNRLTGSSQIVAVWRPGAEFAVSNTV